MPVSNFMFNIRGGREVWRDLSSNHFQECFIYRWELSLQKNFLAKHVTCYMEYVVSLFKII